MFRANGAAEKICAAGFLKSGVETAVFVRFSTVLGSRGSSDTVRDTRGFATKFYTSEGTFDLVGNNIPVFFIQDGIKFPDIIHAGKPHPDREIPQAQSAHDTFWDFVSLHTEASAHTMWNMSDRGIPRSYRMMEGFGVHTFRLIAPDRTTSLVKFHWKPRLGVHSLVWEEAQIAAGVDPDFHRRDLADAIEAGAYPEWDLGVQVFPDTAEQTFEGIDLLDSTKIIPEELAPVEIIGTMQLNANPTNYFAETEQVAFHVGHLVPGIDVTDDPLLHARLFSYLDTQITRLGGPNFGQIPINRPHAPVNDMLRDGFHQHGVHPGVAPYRPNSLDGGCPFMAGSDTGAFIEAPVPLPASVKRRANPASYDDHFSQVTLFYRSLTPIEQSHVVGAYAFELGKCYEQAIKERTLAVLARIDTQLCEDVAARLGLPAPVPAAPPSAPAASPALSQVGGRYPAAGRRIGIITDANSDVGEVAAAVAAITAAKLVPLVFAPHGGTVGHDGVSVPISRTYFTGRSIEVDATAARRLTQRNQRAHSGRRGFPAPQSDRQCCRRAPICLRRQAFRPQGRASSPSRTRRASSSRSWPVSSSTGCGIGCSPADREPHRRRAGRAHRRAVRHRRHRPADPRHCADHHGQQRSTDRGEQPHVRTETACQRAHPESELDIAGAHRRRGQQVHQQVDRRQRCGANQRRPSVPCADGGQRDGRESRNGQPIGQPALPDVTVAQRGHPDQHESNHHGRHANPVRPPSPLAARVAL